MSIIGPTDGERRFGCDGVEAFSPTASRPAGRAFDLEEALAGIPGGIDLAEELAALFLEEYAAVSFDMRRAAAAGETETVRRGAHTLKSSAGIFAAHDMAEAASRVESVARQGDCGGLDAALTDLEREAARVMCELRELRRLRS